MRQIYKDQQLLLSQSWKRNNYKWGVRDKDFWKKSKFESKIHN